MSFWNNNRIRFERRSKEILKEIIITGDIQTLNDFDKECLYSCVENKYLNGVKAIRMASGKIVFEAIKPTIREEGLLYLNPKIDLKFIIASVIAAISVICNIIQLF